MPAGAPVSIAPPLPPRTPSYTPTTQTQALTKASLGPVGGMVDEGVTFQFNPKSIKVSHTAALRELGVKESASSDAGMKPSDPSTMVSSLTAQQELEKQGKTSLTLDNLIFDGAMNVQTNCGRLLNWTYPITRTVVQTGTLKEQTNIYLQPLTFCWGNFNLGEEAPISIQVIMTSCTVSYERFTPSGIPIRASVTVALQPTSPNPTQQNPTSGGLPGRRARVLVSGETLPGIAVAEYGQPGQWRRLAEANHVDDPLRMRPGSSLYLPGRGEVTGQSPA